MIACYPLAVQKDYTELRYSLRSLQQYYPPSEVIVIGEKIPDWLINVTHIQLSDIANNRQLSVRRKILAALEYSGSDILFMNDDFYFLSGSDIPYFFNGDLKSYGYSGSKKLQDRLKELGKPTRNFDLHCPIIFGKDLPEVMAHFPADCLIRSAYCNYLEIKGIQMHDVKFLKTTKPETIIEFIKNNPFMSTGEHSLSSCLPILKELFPNKSNFEL